MSGGPTPAKYAADQKSSAVCVCDANKAIAFADVLAGILVTISAVLNILGSANFYHIYVQVWVAILGVSYVSISLCKNVWTVTWLPFLSHYLGRGLWLLFLGALCGNDSGHHLLQFLQLILQLSDEVIFAGNAGGLDRTAGCGAKGVRPVWLRR